MHFKFTSGNGILDHCKEIHKSLAFCQLKTTNWSAENFKKALNLSELAPEPVLRSCGSGQRIPCFDSCQLTIIWMSIIELNTGYRHFTLVFLWCGRTYGHVMFLSWIDYQIFLGMGLCSRARGAPRKRPLVSCGLVLIMTL